MLDSPTANFLHGLTANQLQAANTDGPVLVLAGAGTGKTRTLTAAVARRIMVSGIDPARIHAVTFTNKAAKEMSGRIQATLGIMTAPRWVGTFHGLGARQLRAEPEVAGLRPGFDILDADDSRRMIKRCMKAMNLAGGSDEPCPPGKDPLKAVVNAISKFKDNLIAPSEAASSVEAMIAQSQHRDRPRSIPMPCATRPPSISTIKGGCVKRTRPILETFCCGPRAPCRIMMIIGGVGLAASIVCIATNIRMFASRNIAGCGFSRPIINNYLSSAMMIRASIAGGAPILAYIRRFAKDFLGATQIKLEENFRSTSHILAAANAIISFDRHRIGKALFTKKIRRSDRGGEIP